MLPKPKREYTRDPVRIEASKKLIQILVKQFSQENKLVDVETLPVDYGKNNSVNLEGKKPKQLNLHPNRLSILCASITGDGSINKNTGYKNPRIQYRHSTRQVEWFMWKTKGPFGRYLTDSSPQFQAPDGNQKNTPRLPNEALGKIKVSTRVNEEITSVFGLLAPKGKKTLNRSWLNHMTSWFLVVLWLDDGGLHGESRRLGSISVNGFSLDEANVLADYITVVWGAKCRAVSYQSKEKRSNNKESPQIDFADLENLKTFLRIVAPLIPVKSMLYKVCLSPLDDDSRQRWITELKTLVRPDWHDEIDKIYLYDIVLERQTGKDRYSNQILDVKLDSENETWIYDDL